MNQASTTASPQQNSALNWLRWANLVFMLYLLLLAVSMVGSGFKLATGEQLKRYLHLPHIQSQG